MKCNFENNTFSYKDWSVPCLIYYDDIKAQLDSYNLCGRMIKSIRIPGLCYNYQRDHIESYAYSLLKEYDEETRQYFSDYNNIDTETEYFRHALIDEPLIIEFTDGDTFEIDTPMEPEFCMSMNKIPLNIKAGVNTPNADGNILFSPCLNQTISSVEIDKFEVTEDEETGEPFDTPPYTRYCVDSVTLRFKNGYGIKINGFIDYCEATYVDKDNNPQYIKFKDLKKALFNPEDIHSDPTVGFISDSDTIFFGEEGRCAIEEEYMTFSLFRENKTDAYIPIKDFIVLNWSITQVTKKPFDMYGNYYFTKEQWLSVLDFADKILKAKSIFSLYVILLNPKTHCKGHMLYTLRNFADEYLRSHSSYCTQIESMREWSNRAMSPASILHIFGF